MNTITQPAPPGTSFLVLKGNSNRVTSRPLRTLIYRGELVVDAVAEDGTMLDDHHHAAIQFPNGVIYSKRFRTMYAYLNWWRSDCNHGGTDR